MVCGIVLWFYYELCSDPIFLATANSLILHCGYRWSKKGFFPISEISILQTGCYRIILLFTAAQAA
ncbi:hypothetical protein DBO95_14600 [Yersinia pestis]|nr:hypothetical protein DBO95_14600 [Yersinia pestis]